MATGDAAGRCRGEDPPSPSRPGQRSLRTWQVEALAAHAGTEGPDFLVTATPGSGKTAFALALAGRLLSARRVDRIVVVCPTDHLRSQWSAAAAELGIGLDPALSNTVGPVRSDLRGYVTTYAQVAGRPLLHRRRVEARRTLVVLDEIHHAGDGLTWGDAVREAFDPARSRLALTGTPFRTRADERIPFVRYAIDGPDGDLVSDADYTYGYRQALADDVVRPVVFAAYTGVSRWRNSAGEVVSASLTEPLSRSAETTAWRTALDPGGAWVPHVMAAMDDRLSHLRSSGMPDAAGLVLASDQADARAYARILQRVTGHRPVVILSDDRRASQKLAAFAGSDDRYAVCVRMISEGVDVPRAAVLAWLTSYRTPLFFAQAVGRVVRARRPGECATVFLPAVRPLLTLAAELESERNQVTPGPSGDSLDPVPEAQARRASACGWQPLDAEAEFAHVLHGGRAVLADPACRPLSAEDEAYLGLPGLLTAEQTAAALASRDEELRLRVRPAARDGAAEQAGQPGSGVRDRVATMELRREINQLVARVAVRTGASPAAVHTRLRAQVPGPPSASATAELLRRRRDHLLGRL